MRRCDVRTPEQVVAYLLDCELATVAEMAMKKSRNKRGFSRHIEIAEQIIDWMDEMCISKEGTRAEEIKGTVWGWARGYMPEFK